MLRVVERDTGIWTCERGAPELSSMRVSSIRPIPKLARTSCASRKAGHWMSMVQCPLDCRRVGSSVDDLLRHVIDDARETDLGVDRPEAHQLES
jgi:hypothetical protein